ncbi:MULTISPECIES: class II aldolase/adducin family protein [unclassified Mesorhizobium]|uniref:class II aldolase/adducin family protein n=1 Tax=unclassified Mesorhizobium TaxID=325217 RepID=UPI001CCBB24B|nr:MULTISPECIES: class II aldolase/adducin family protein [unclassified Mesorhizobium]MBZ9820540.1 class II aldolase/adducin family protein [Mesorhizobium sp. CA4]
MLQPAATSEEHTARMLRLACRAIARAGLVTAFGHCSARLDADHLLVGPPKAPGRIQVGEACTIVEINAPLPAGVLGEVRVHQQIYRRRPDVSGVCRFYSPSLMPLSLMGKVPAARDVFSAYFAPSPPLWLDTRLLRQDELAAGVAEMMGAARGIVLRGNGAVTAGSSLPEAVALAWMLDQAGRVELSLHDAGGSETAMRLNAVQAADLGQFAGREVERLWDMLTAEDQEADG